MTLVSRTYTIIGALLALVFVSALTTEDNKPDYPETRRVEQVDTLHGVKVADPYRWLEDDVRNSKDVADWIEVQNKFTFDYLKTIPEREKIRRRLTELWNFAQYSQARKAGGRYYFLKNDGLQNQPVLYRLDTLDGKPQALIDPNKWSKDGTIALQGYDFSDDGKYVAYGRSEAGSDWATWYIMEIESGKILSDELKWTKFTQAAWTKDGKGFFYSRYEEPKSEAMYQALNYDNKLYYHRVGTPQTDDVLVYYRPEYPEWLYRGDVTDDGRYLVITTELGSSDRYRIAIRDLSEPLAMAVEIISNFDNEYTFVGNEGPVFFFKTDLAAPRRRLIAIDLGKPKKADWKEIIPQAEGTLTQVSCVGDRFIAIYLKDVLPQVKIYSLAGKSILDWNPGIGTISGFSGKRTDTETFYSFTSFTTPPTIYHYDIPTGKSTLFRRAEAKVKSSDYEVKQFFYESRDGTRVPIFLAYKKGIALDGMNPTLLYGYGGYNISLLPTFSIARVAWMEMGGIYAQANLRGGGEYGEEWHQAGTKMKKQNVFDDFIAAAQWLSKEKYTKPLKLAIQGGSNGGLLVGAVMTQRPYLFGACLPAVGVMDMLRFHLFTEGRTWTEDFGSPEDPEQFKALLNYSPYHNIKSGMHYPPTLVTTADTDDRVVPGHSFKFIASLQRAQSGEAPVLIRVETRAGHGGGMPVSKKIDEVTDQLAFLVKNLGIKLPY